MCYTHTTEYYSALKRKETLAATKMTFEDSILSEISQSQTLHKSVYTRFLVLKLTETKSKKAVFRDKGKKKPERI
jgi:hypothetical protein